MLTVIIISSAVVLFVVAALIASRPKPAPRKKSTRKTPLQHMVEAERKMFGKLSEHR